MRKESSKKKLQKLDEKELKGDPKVSRVKVSEKDAVYNSQRRI